MELAVPDFVLDASSQRDEPLRAPLTSFGEYAPQVAAHRHKVMPSGDRFRAIQIGVDLKPTIRAVEIRLRRTQTEMQTARASLRGIAGLDEDHLPPRLGGLVGDHLLQLGEAPIVDAVGFPILPNPVEVFEDDPLVVRFRIGDDLFANAMVGVRDKTSFPARDTPERAFG